MTSWLDEERTWVSHLPASYADFLISCCALSGLNADSINLIATLLWSSVFAWFWQFQRSPFNRQLTSTLFSIVVLYAFYGPYSFMAIIAIIAGAYPVFQTRNVQLISLYAWAQLFIVFIYFWYFYRGSFRMDISATTMGLLVRLQFIAYDQQDMDKYKKNERLSKNEKIHKFRMRQKLDKEIGFYDFFSYQVCFLHALAGSNMTTMDYFRLIDLRQFKDCEKIPQANAFDFLKQFGKVAINAVIYLVFSIQILTIDRVYEDWFMEYNVFLRSVYIGLTLLACKQRYHLVWHLVELPVLASGAAYSGKDESGNIQWEKHKNIHSWRAEFGEKAKYLTFNWNMTVNIWLKHYFLDRLEDLPLSQDFKILLTRGAGSLFHGVYSGPHNFFFWTVPHSIFFTPVLDHFFGLSRDHRSALKSWAVYILRVALNTWLINSYGCSMVWIQYKEWVALNNIQMWIGQIVLTISCFVKLAIVDPARRRRKKRKNATIAGGLKEE